MRWQRDRMVGSSSSAPAVTRTIIARGGGSSIVLSSLFAAASLSRLRPRTAATTLRSPSIGLRDTSSMMACASSTRIWVPRRIELDDVGVHAPQTEIPRALVGVGRDDARRRSTARPPRGPSRGARRADRRAPVAPRHAAAAPPPAPARPPAPSLESSTSWASSCSERLDGAQTARDGVASPSASTTTQPRPARGRGTRRGPRRGTRRRRARSGRRRRRRRVRPRRRR